ncbi:hypothetical protein DAPPUDRAFT_335907 [Daphnia pulex]|uniref:Uncharacterized protein n=1 Tax=Daphnia pulex TaxID=6669 RepID=E9HYQ7_DAPPU|nr:hypothetical protein DAPPUDRAFT_335907 [Daphnia pulex]|eukprot:EFX63123.1 hypothetical protein DAPPUDRAFT_335907 [Daphnia pulex]
MEFMEHIQTVILENRFDMKECVVDFERAVWLAIEKVFGIDVKIFGCLTRAYRNPADTLIRVICKKFMSLHLLPHCKIPTAFVNLRSCCQDIANREQRLMMRKLCDYIENTWIDSLLWPPKVWSVFMQEVRTTNDVEVWHTHLANHADLRIYSRGLNLYILLEVLNEEAVQVDLYTKMLEQGQSLRRQRKTYRELNEKLFKFWDDYNKQHLTSKELLGKCANIYTHFNAIK